MGVIEFIVRMAVGIVVFAVIAGAFLVGFTLLLAWLLCPMGPDVKED